RQERAAPRAPGPVAPGRAVEVRRNAAGEEVPVRPPIAGPALARAPVTSGDELAKVRKKLTAEPLFNDALRARGGAPSPEAQKSAALGETQPTASPAPSMALPPP